MAVAPAMQLTADIHHGPVAAGKAKGPTRVTWPFRRLAHSPPVREPLVAHLLDLLHRHVLSHLSVVTVALAEAGVDKRLLKPLLVQDRINGAPALSDIRLEHAGRHLVGPCILEQTPEPVRRAAVPSCCPRGRLLTGHGPLAVERLAAHPWNLRTVHSGGHDALLRLCLLPGNLRPGELQATLEQLDADVHRGRLRRIPAVLLGGTSATEAVRVARDGGREQSDDTSHETHRHGLRIALAGGV
mmetsp:Transcript_68395/g.154881  ORF Transcript_68395/g.154881 Transcript_68395/m.154881 type:complete len:243 (+) Transcript_68395:103-831(+)